MVRSVFLLAILCWFNHDVYASHAAAVDLGYTCLGNGAYEYTLTLYRSCGGAFLDPSYEISLESGSCSQSIEVLVTRDTIIDVSQVCNNLLVNTTCNGGTMPGIEKHVYRVVDTLPMVCSDWLLSFTLSFRNAGITNLVNPNAQELYVEALIDNTQNKCNSSPTFSALPVPFICVGQPFNYNHGAVDPDGDQLTYTLIDPRISSNITIAHMPGYSATNPVSAAGSFIFNQTTGQIQFTPDIQQQSVVSVLIEEFNDQGNLMGTTVRDLQIIVIPCDNILPVATGIDSSAVNFEYSVCSGTPFCFEVFASDEDVGQQVSMNWNNGINAATFTIIDDDFLVGEFCWEPTSADVGNHLFTVNVIDDACPMPGFNNYTYQINVLPGAGAPIDAGQNQEVCEGETVTLEGIVGSNATFEWTPTDGFNCMDCVTPSFTAADTATYQLSVNYGNGCLLQDSVQVNVLKVAEIVSVLDSQVICLGDTIQLYAEYASERCIWNVGNSIFENDGQPFAFTFDSVGVYDVLVHFDPPNNRCIDSTHVLGAFEVASPPIASYINADEINIFSSTLALLDNSEGEVVDWKWSFITSDSIVLEISNQQNPAFDNPAQTGEYVIKLVVTSDVGCVDDTLGRLIIDDDMRLFVPNAFSPNANKLNDVFIPKGFGYESADYRFTIFDRWGSVVFQTNDYEEGWNGLVGSNQEATNDVYVWKITLGDPKSKNKQQFVGTVNVVR
ncbi:gliding motility-associated C-terminal domain-containing protein [Flavobacteriales bacterium]|nr:gliding motility-associated C-terminal domain-containing protein [Flavobacteriales bacterium]